LIYSLLYSVLTVYVGGSVEASLYSSKNRVDAKGGYTLVPGVKFPRQERNATRFSSCAEKKLNFRAVFPSIVSWKIDFISSKNVPQASFYPSVV
jgi:hypothetical protein